MKLKLFFLSVVFTLKASAQVTIVTQPETNKYCLEVAYDFYPSTVVYGGCWTTNPMSTIIQSGLSNYGATITFTVTGTYTINLLYTTSYSGGNQHGVKTVI